MPKRRFSRHSRFSSRNDVKLCSCQLKTRLAIFLSTLLALRLGFLLFELGSTVSIATDLFGGNWPQESIQPTSITDTSTEKEEVASPSSTPVKKQTNALNDRRDIDIKTNHDPEIEKLNQQKIHFLTGSLHINDRIDAFSASWLQRREEFMLMNATEIRSCEDAAFNAYWGPMERVRRLRLTVDWLDFSIEHMSKWHKILNLLQEKEEVFQSAIAKFDQYISMSIGNPQLEDASFRETVATIAFQAYKDEVSPGNAYTLTVKSLGATLESLRRAGFGRVVVVGLHSDEGKIVTDTVHHWQNLHSRGDGQPVKQNASHEGIVGMLGHMEVAFVQASLESAVSMFVPQNVPKAAVLGLHTAFKYSEIPMPTRTQVETDYIRTWLGKKEDYKYIYLTEPDCILNFRPSSMRQLKEEVDKGMVLTPHRLQPIPHESDAKGNSREFRYLPESFAPVVDLDVIGNHDVCCDDWKGHNTKPGLPPLFPDCGSFWYMCDFLENTYKRENAHERLKAYQLMRLKQGTGIVSLAATEHGRPCKIQKRSVCLPKR